MNLSTDDWRAVEHAVGAVPRIAYECAHVYPLSAPMFEEAHGLLRPPADAAPLQVYIHVPFCNYSCGFCFYYKQIGVGVQRREEFVAALELEARWIPTGTVLQQLYVGGGTPTALSADLLARSLDAVLTRTTASRSTPKTVECSPESLSHEHVRVFHERGVNRVSLGVDTLDESILLSINRRHDQRQALSACEMLREADLAVNVDLIYGFDGQSKESFRSDFAALAALGPISFTCYSLRLNERTPLIRRAGEHWSLPELAAWRDFVAMVAAEHGYLQTRWHTFSRKNADAPAYQRAPCVDGFGNGHQIGLGPSALSHLGGSLFRNASDTGAYVEHVTAGGSPITEVFPLREADLKTLYIVRTLGDLKPLSTAGYESLFGSSFGDDYDTSWTALREAGLLTLMEDGETIQMTDLGAQLYDLVTLAFYPESARRWLNQKEQLISA